MARAGVSNGMYFPYGLGNRVVERPGAYFLYFLYFLTGDPMADMPTPAPGSITWFDLTVPNATEVRDFYASVTGWSPQPVSMGEYDDFNMVAPGATAPIAGICHARGGNADIPPVWMMYITVADLDASLEACRARGGEVLAGPKAAGPTARYAIIRDPAGAVVSLYQPAQASQ